MDKRERLQATISGNAVDRIAVAAWRHQPVDDQSADAFAAATMAFQGEFDFDFVKVTPASSYCVRDWGASDAWTGHPHGTRDYEAPCITSPDDWERLGLLDPRRGQMGEIIRALELIGANIAQDTPFIQTIFSPLTQARNLLGPEQLVNYLRQYPDAARKGLRTITEQTISFIDEARKSGISGIFYALQWASYLNLSEEEYREFARPYDLEILEAVRDLWLNVLHLHGNEVMFGVVVDYPAAILNWHDRETWPTLSVGMEKWPQAVCGGIRQEATLVQGTPNDVRTEAMDAIKSTGGRRFVLGTGCVAPIVTPYGNLRALRDVVDVMHE